MTEKPWNINICNKPIILPALLLLLQGISELANRRVMGIRRRGKNSNKNINQRKKEIHLLLGSRDSAQLIHAECNPILLYIILRGWKKIKV